MKVVAMVQARENSTRFPKKVLERIGHYRAIELLLHRLRLSKAVDQTVVLTGPRDENKQLTECVESLGIDVFHGSRLDVFSRYISAAALYEADLVVRITGDCPFVCSSVVDRCVIELKLNNADYCCNIDPPTFPDGLDVEVLKASCLTGIDQDTLSRFDREHVTTALRRSAVLKKINILSDADRSSIRLTLDERADLLQLRSFAQMVGDPLRLSLQELLGYCDSGFFANAINRNVPRNEGSKMHAGKKMWRRAKEVIPGGGMLLSKRPEMFSPDLWPTYFSRAKGCTVWDLDGRSFIDVGLMGVGTNILGYAQEDVNEAVIACISSGNMSSLNCVEEVWLAERLVDITPSGDMVRFARTGGEANAIAIRIARAASQKSKVAVCGYHGWHDWYLSVNLAQKSGLDDLLLPGLEPLGVPSELKNLTLPFSYGDSQSLAEIFNEEPELGCVKLEVCRSTAPDIPFLREVRNLCNKYGAVLIFDECTSGFRQSFGGLHKLCGVDPDLTVYGKALGNGHPITAVVGTKEVMDCAQSTFISSTFWTDRTGPVAALKTLEVMETTKSWCHITDLGIYLQEQWKLLGAKHDLPLTVGGLPALANFSIDSPEWMSLKTFMTNFFLERGYLASNSIYVSTAHTHEMIDDYLEHLDEVFGLFSDHMRGTAELKLPTAGNICHNGFKRLN